MGSSMKRIACLDANSRQFIKTASEPRPDVCVANRPSQLWSFDVTTGIVPIKLEHYNLFYGVTNLSIKLERPMASLTSLL